MSATQNVPITFQGLIQTLNQYWAQQGCVLIQPLDLEVGAGTFHPATFLRSIGPETWNAAYVQPSRRPTDGRYGENPNRLQRYYQYQVAMKPSPDNIQQLYLDSLKALGIDPLVHDPLADPGRARQEYGIDLAGLDAFRDLDALVLAVPHRAYLDRPPDEFWACLKDGGLVMDVKSALDPASVPPRLSYWSL